MADTVDVKVKITSVIDNLSDTGDGSIEPEITSVSAEGKLARDGGAILLKYSESTEGGKIYTFMEVTESSVALDRKGAVKWKVRFSEGERVDTVYEIPPYSFDATVETRKVRSALTERGGELRLFYSMNIGGQEKRCSMKIEVTP